MKFWLLLLPGVALLVITLGWITWLSVHSAPPSTAAPISKVVSKVIECRRSYRCHDELRR